ncbi:MAG: nuclear pore complex subunit [Bacteroidetes bacterium]|nr:MAG: nuclear pore complex subunit [Bacteroidota bacterium]
MEKLYIKSTEDTPEIYFAPDENIFSISKKSLPEDAIAFFHPVFSWLNNYIDNPNEKNIFTFKLDYFSTSTAKQLVKIFFLLEKLSENKEVVIKWYYQKEDTDMYASGLKYSKLIDLPFELIQY